MTWQGKHADLAIDESISLAESEKQDEITPADEARAARNEQGMSDEARAMLAEIDREVDALDRRFAKRAG